MSCTLRSISLIGQISIGELLRDTTELEDRLSRIFKTASHWNATLLLDEADVFLERRALNDLTRNGLVSVLLRRLEYYEGILFLTTNRMAQFDEAILSRIHLLLRYENLTQVARRQVWKDFLSRATTEVTEKGLEGLAISPLNGRQVSYLTKTLAFVSLISPSDKEYYVRSSGFCEKGGEQDRTSTRNEGSDRKSVV